MSVSRLTFVQLDCVYLLKIKLASSSTSNFHSLHSCPETLFRCTYGACIDAKECDGVQECLDESDERSINCPGIINEIRGNCR